MSLALGVDVAASQGTTRLTALVGSAMTAALALAAAEQFALEEGGRGGLAASLAVLAAAWCIVLCRRSATRRPVWLKVKPDGSIGLAPREGQETVAAAVVSAWQLGGVVCLRLRPAGAAFGSVDCLFLIVRRSLDQSSWHGLLRWLVWLRRSGRAGGAAA